MRWSDLGRSKNLEDDRGASGGIGGYGKMGLGGVVVVLLVALITGQNPLTLLEGASNTPTANAPAAPINDQAEEREVRFVSFVFDTAQQMWSRELPAGGAAWRDAHLVLFRDAIGTGCGGASSASGPFYCPADEKVYIDLGFFDELKSRFGAPGEFAQAYVLAHEIGHHVQKLRGRVNDAERGNGASIAVELQADCYAGAWAHTAAAEGIVEAGDIESGLAAAAAVGDDRLQRMGGGGVHPESWTHGSSAQRVAAFRRGFAGGNAAACQ